MMTRTCRLGQIYASDWDIVPLGEVFKVSSGNGLTQKKIIEGPYAVYGGNGISGYHNAYLFEESKLTIGRVGAYCGCIHLTEPKSWITDNALYIRDIYKAFDTGFMVELLKNSKLNGLANKNAQPVVSGQKLYKVNIPFPPLPEQKKIAKILSTVDEHINEVDGMIADLKELKKGLMQKLLTQGIGHTEFKDSAVGRIPVEWEVKKLDDISILMTNGFVGTASPYYTTADAGTKYLQSNNVRMNKIDITKMVYVNDEFVEQYPKTRVFEGDMLTVQSGHIGTSCIVPTEYDNSNCHALIITRFDKRKVYPCFVSHYLNSHNGQNRLTKIFVGSTIKHINVRDFKKIIVPVPPINEQEQIASTINSVDNRIDIQYVVLKQYKELKKALMQQLLTGKTRVKLDN